MSIGDFPMRRIREWGPLGRYLYLGTILAGILKMQFSVLTLSLGQSLPSRVLSGGRLQPRVGRCILSVLIHRLSEEMIWSRVISDCQSQLPLLLAYLYYSFLPYIHLSMQLVHIMDLHHLMHYLIIFECFCHKMKLFRSDKDL